jgi:hypothetical protein
MNDNRTMIVSPVAQLLKSRKVIVALVTALVNIIVLLLPSLQPVQGELVVILTTLGTVLMASISYEDGKEKGAPQTITTGSAESVNVNQAPPATPEPPTPGDVQRFTPPLPRTPLGRN